MAAQQASVGTPRRALIVEDSIIIAMEAEGCLRELGVGEVELTGSVAGALAAIDAADFEVAILDYNLGDETSDAVADLLRQQRVPFAVATGYDDMDGHFSRMGAVTVLVKPYSKADLRDLLRIVADRQAKAA